MYEKRKLPQPEALLSFQTHASLLMGSLYWWSCPAFITAMITALSSHWNSGERLLTQPKTAPCPTHNAPLLSLSLHSQSICWYWSSQGTMCQDWHIVNTRSFSNPLISKVERKKIYQLWLLEMQFPFSIVGSSCVSSVHLPLKTHNATVSPVESRFVNPY